MLARKVILTSVLSLTPLLLLTSCSHPYHQPTERYVLVAANVHLPYWQEAAAGFMDVAREYGVKAEVAGPATYDPKQELDAFQKAVASDPSGILLSPANPQTFTAAINSAVQQGIPVITMDSDAPSSRRLLFIGTNNEAAGSEGALHLAEALHSEGNVVIISIPGQLNQEERLSGATRELAAFPKIKVMAQLDDQGQTGTADDEISKLLAEKKPIDGVLCLEASGGPGAAEVAYRLDLIGKIKIVAFDKSPETLDWISRHAIVGTVAQKPYTMAYYGLTFLDDLHHNAVPLFKNWRTAPVNPLPARVDTGTAWIDSSNLAAFKAAMAGYQQPASSM